jgi:hypothetical protein
MIWKSSTPAAARTRGVEGVSEDAKSEFSREFARFALQLHVWL